MQAQVFQLHAQARQASLPAELPTVWESWQLGSPRGGYDAARQAALWQAIERTRQYGAWRWPDRTVHFIADPHADAEAFQASLLATGDVRRCRSGRPGLEPTARGRRALFVLGGDCLDKGPSNLALLRSIAMFRRHGARLVLLAGNHDVRFLVGLRALGRKQAVCSEHLFLRMGPKVIPLLREVRDEYVQSHHMRQVPEEAACRAFLYPSDDWFDQFPQAASDWLSVKSIEKEVRRMRRKMESFEGDCANAGLTLREVYAAAFLCRRLFLDRDGEFSWFGRTMKLMHREGSFLFLHAGVDNQVAARISSKGVSAVNKQYRRHSRQNLFAFYFGPLVNVMRTKYRDTDLALTTQGVEQLHRAGIYAIVQGHRNRTNGQRIMLRQGLLHIESDVTLDRHSRCKEGLPGIGVGVTTILPSGHVLGISNDYPCVKVFAPDTSVQGLPEPTGQMDVTG